MGMANQKDMDAGCRTILAKNIKIVGLKQRVRMYATLSGVVLAHHKRNTQTSRDHGEGDVRTPYRKGGQAISYPHPSSLSSSNV